MGVLVVPQPRAYLGRPVLVVSDLASLRGPVTGVVELPIWVFWSASADFAGFSLDDPVSRQ